MFEEVNKRAYFMKAMTIAAIFASMTVTTIAQAEVYKWQDDLCDIKGSFDNKKYTANQIKNSHFMLNNLNTVQLNSFSSPVNPSDIDKVSTTDITNLDKEYELLKGKVQQLEVVPAAQTYKRELLKSIEGEYVHDKLTILAYLYPVQAMRLSPPMCKQYLTPFFESETAVQSKWEQLVEKRALSNSYAMSHYQEQRASDPENYAKINLLTYGFSNCVNDQIYHADSNKVFSNYNQLNKTIFGKSISMVCDEP